MHSWSITCICTFSLFPLQPPVFDCTSLVAPFPGFPTIQFLITYSIQEQRRKAWEILQHESHHCVHRYTEVRTASRPFLLKCLSQAFSTLKTCCSLFRVRNKYTKYNAMRSFNTTPLDRRGVRLPSADVIHVSKPPRPPPCIFAYL